MRHYDTCFFSDTPITLAVDDLGGPSPKATLKLRPTGAKGPATVTIFFPQAMLDRLARASAAFNTIMTEGES